jgi:hypothetical protein
MLVNNVHQQIRLIVADVECSAAVAALIAFCSWKMIADQSIDETLPLVVKILVGTLYSVAVTFAYKQTYKAINISYLTHMNKNNVRAKKNV